MFNVTCCRFFHVTILSVVAELGLVVRATDTELQVVVVPAILAITSGVVVQQLGFIRTFLKLLTTRVVVTEVLPGGFITDLMVTVASLAIVCWHLLAAEFSTSMSRIKSEELLAPAMSYRTSEDRWVFGFQSP